MKYFFFVNFFSREIEGPIFLTELKRLRGRLEVVRCSLESGIAI